MASGKSRRRFSADFKAKVAMDALRDVEPITEIAARHGVHRSQVRDWRRQAEAQIKAAFGGGEKAKAESEATIKALCEQVGQLTMERDFFGRASGR